MDPVDTEDIIHRLAIFIDADEPPGLAAHKLARAAVCLVRDREPRDAIALGDELNRLAFDPRFRRYGS